MTLCIVLAKLETTTGRLPGAVPTSIGIQLALAFSNSKDFRSERRRREVADRGVDSGVLLYDSGNLFVERFGD